MFLPVFLPEKILGDIGPFQFGQVIVQFLLQFRLAGIRERRLGWRLEQGVELFVRHRTHDVQRNLGLPSPLLVGVDGSLAHMKLAADVVQ